MFFFGVLSIILEGIYKTEIPMKGHGIVALKHL